MQIEELSDEKPRQNKGRGLVDRKLVILDVARCYLWLFTLYINIKIGENSCLMLD